MNEMGEEEVEPWERTVGEVWLECFLMAAKDWNVMVDVECNVVWGLEMGEVEAEEEMSIISFIIFAGELFLISISFPQQ
jgi:hypothetical protein